MAQTVISLVIRRLKPWSFIIMDVTLTHRTTDALNFPEDIAVSIGDGLRWPWLIPYDDYDGIIIAQASCATKVRIY
jgi:hypothetical protein